MFRTVLIHTLIFLIACNHVESLFIQNLKGVGREKNFDDGYNIYVIKSTHALKKRDVSIVPAAGVQPKEETVIIVPNSGVNNYPYGSNYYPTNSRYGANPGTTVVVSNPDGNYNNGYGSRYFPNTIPKYG